LMSSIQFKKKISGKTSKFWEKLVNLGVFGIFTS
jgi:hypothetical protein